MQKLWKEQLGNREKEKHKLVLINILLVVKHLSEIIVIENTD